MAGRQHGAAEHGLPGLAIAYRDTHQMWVSADGFANLDTGEAWQPAHHRRIGSVTKTFAAALVFQLVVEGAITLEDPVEKWVPGWYEGVTVREMPGHTSGIVSYNYVGLFGGSRP